MDSYITKSRRPSLWRTVLIGRQPKFTLLRILVLIVVIIFARHFFLLPIRIIGPSMLPTYQDHGVNLVNRIAYRSHEPARGDVVAIRTSGESIMFMKRIIGLPGETVVFHKGHVTINGQELAEPYVIYPCDWELPPVTVEASKYLVIGDNRSMSADAHTFGQTERQRIVGKILLCKNLFASSVPLH